MGHMGIAYCLVVRLFLCYLKRADHWVGTSITLSSDKMSKSKVLFLFIICGTIYLQGLIV